MDRLDKKILKALQRDASVTNSALAESIGLSPSSCLRRVRRLRDERFIDRIVAVLNPSKFDVRLKAVVTVKLREHGERRIQDFLNRAIAESAVIQAYAVTGDVDIIVVVRFRDMEEFDAVSERLFRGRNVAQFQTMIAIKTAKEDLALSL